jgi:hypothetical protein
MNMTITTFEPAPEVNRDLIVAPARMTIYPSAVEPDALSVMLVSDDEYRDIQGGLRLTPEQVETLFYALGEHVGDELFDAGFKSGVKYAAESVRGAMAVIA